MQQQEGKRSSTIPSSSSSSGPLREPRPTVPPSARAVPSVYWQRRLIASRGPGGPIEADEALESGRRVKEVSRANGCGDKKKKRTKARAPLARDPESANRRYRPRLLIYGGRKVLPCDVCNGESPGRGRRERLTFAAAVAEREIGPRGRRVRSERQAGPRGARMLYSYLPRRPDANDSCPRASIQPLCVLHSSQLRTFCFFVLSRRGIAEYGDLVRRFHFDRTRKLSSIYEGDGRSMGASFCDGRKLLNSLNP